MRMVKRENASYEDFQEMRQYILDTAPYGLINDIYDSKNRIGYLYFWDSDYIPPAWEKNGWVVRPVSKKTKEPDVSEEYEYKNQLLYQTAMKIPSITSWEEFVKFRGNFITEYKNVIIDLQE